PGSCTIECWTTYQGAANSILVDGTRQSGAAGPAGTDGKPIRLFDDGTRLALQFNDDLAGTVNVVRPAAALMGGQTYHVVFRILNGVVSLYLDGVSVAVTESASGVQWPAWVNLLKAFNSYGYDPARPYFDDWPWRGGLVDDLAIYPVALSPAQILAHYNAAATPPGGVTRIAVSSADATGGDATPMLSGLMTGDLVSMTVEWAPESWPPAVVTWQLTAAPIDHTSWWELPVTARAVTDAYQLYFFQNGQMIVASHTVAGAALAVGDVVRVDQPYQLLEPGARALTVATDATLGTLLLFIDGTFGWFDAAAEDAYGVAKTAHNATFETYVYTTDLTLHEDWRGGFFDRAWGGPPTTTTRGVMPHGS